MAKTSKPFDWTRGPDGRSNSSPEFTHLCSVVERLIRDSAFELVSGHAEITARVIMGMLAHKHGMAPVEMVQGNWVIKRRP